MLAAPKPLPPRLIWEKDFLVQEGGDHICIFLQNIWILIKMNTIFFFIARNVGKKITGWKSRQKLENLAKKNIFFHVIHLDLIQNPFILRVLVKFLSEK